MYNHPHFYGSHAFIGTAVLLLLSLSVKANDTTKHCCKIPSRKTVVSTQVVAKTVNDQHASPHKQNGMVLVKGGSFVMGSKDFPDAMPLHSVEVADFWMDEHEVTNEQFAAFVKATGYKTVAERPLNPKDYPGVPADKLQAGSAVFAGTNPNNSLSNALDWWQFVAGANWQHPTGPNSDIKGKEKYPVVQICYDDALAYAKWAGKRLPTEAEWEYAARAGRPSTVFYWGEEQKPAGKWVANIFQGKFPTNNTLEDGFSAAAPVKSFPANPFGLYDLDGNVWEWCSDWYRPDYYDKSPKTNPQGPNDSYDPDEPGIGKRVQRGGSFLCSDEYCIRYKAGSRGKGDPSSAANHLGFRCVKAVVKKNKT